MLMIYLLLIALAVTAFVTLFEPTAALYFARRLDAASSILKAHASARAAARAAYRNIYRYFRRTAALTKTEREMVILRDQEAMLDAIDCLDEVIDVR